LLTCFLAGAVVDLLSFVFFFSVVELTSLYKESYIVLDRRCAKIVYQVGLFCRKLKY
jgi:hypothetical protein